MSDQIESLEEVTESQSAELPEVESIRVTEPREGLPEIVSTPEQLAKLVAAISGGTGVTRSGRCENMEINAASSSPRR